MRAGGVLHPHAVHGAPVPVSRRIPRRRPERRIQHAPALRGGKRVEIGTQIGDERAPVPPRRRQRAPPRATEQRLERDRAGILHPVPPIPAPQPRQKAGMRRGEPGRVDRGDELVLEAQRRRRGHVLLQGPELVEAEPFPRPEQRLEPLHPLGGDEEIAHRNVEHRGRIVGRGEESLLRVQRPGQLGRVREALPFAVRIGGVEHQRSGDRLAPARQPDRHDLADIPRDIGELHVLPAHRIGRERGAELRRRAGACDGEEGADLVAGLAPGPAERHPLAGKRPEMRRIRDQRAEAGFRGR